MRRALGGAMDFAGETPGLTASSADTSAMSILSELISAAMVEVDASKSEDKRGRFSVRFVGESFFVDMRLLVVAVESVLTRTDEGVLMVPFGLTGVFNLSGLLCI